MAVRGIVALLLVWLFSVNRDAQLLLIAPLLILTLHLWYLSRIRKRHERMSWQGLASSAEALNDVDLDGSWRSPSSGRPISSRPTALRSRSSTPTRHGSSAAPAARSTPSGEGEWPTDAFVITTVLEGRADKRPIGELRLRFRGPVTLNEMENYKLRTFASALNTAIHNASAYAELQRVAVVHAHEAAHDALTGLANRRQLLDQGQKVITGGHADGVIALLLLDLNHFKEVNDTLGHAAGDDVLKQVADRLKATARTGDLVARLGGDEFAVLMTGLPAPAVAAHRADLLIARPARADRGRGHADQRRGQRRHRDRAEHRRHRRTAPPRRRRDVPGQALRPADRHLLARPRHRRHRPPRARPAA